MNKLPRVFNSIRMAIPKHRVPHVVIALQFDPFETVNGWLKQEERPDGGVTLEISFWRNFWIEMPLQSTTRHVKSYAMHCELPDGATDQSFEQLRVSVFNNEGRPRGKFVIGDVWMLEPPMTHEQEAYSGLSAGLANALHYLNVRERYERDPDPVAAAQRNNRVESFTRVGDTIRYERVNYSTVRRIAIARAAPPKSPDHVPAYHKRQHEVMGHWRTMKKSGKRVFVRAHQRGDPKLGVVTKVIIGHDHL